MALQMRLLMVSYHGRATKEFGYFQYSNIHNRMKYSWTSNKKSLLGVQLCSSYVTNSFIYLYDARLVLP